MAAAAALAAVLANANLALHELNVSVYKYEC